MSDNPVQQDNQRGALLCMVFGMVLVTLQDSTVKWLSDDYSLYQIVLCRAVVAIGVIIAIMLYEGGLHHMRTSHPWMLLGRGFIMVIANLFFFMGVVALPIAEAMAILFVSPLIITVLAIPLLGEKVGGWRWMAVVAGFIGVIIMLRPGEGTWRYAAIFPVIAACAYATVQMIARRMRFSEKASTMAFYLQVMFLCTSIIAGLWFGDGRYGGGSDPSLAFVFRAWAWPDLNDALIMLAGGFLVGTGNYLLTQAYRLGEASSVAPFEYVALPMAMFWGFIMWGDWPDTVAFAGMALIVGSGLFVFYRETVRKRPVVTKRPMLRGR